MLKQTCKGKAREAVSCCDWPSFSECQCQAKLPKLTSFNQLEPQIEPKWCEQRFFFKSTQQSVALCKINFEASYFTLKKFFCVTVCCCCLYAPAVPSLLDQKERGATAMWSVFVKQRALLKLSEKLLSLSINLHGWQNFLLLEPTILFFIITHTEPCPQFWFFFFHVKSLLVCTTCTWKMSKGWIWQPSSEGKTTSMVFSESLYWLLFYLYIFSLLNVM